MTGNSEKSRSGTDHPGARAAFPYNRVTMERFRESFPRARWRDDLKVWFVPGKTAAERFNRWLDRELGGSSAYADARGGCLHLTAMRPRSRRSS